MSPIEEAIREKLFPELFRREEINADFRQILGCSVKHEGSAPWVATTAAWPVPAPVARGPTRTAQPHATCPRALSDPEDKGK